MSQLGRSAKVASALLQTLDTKTKNKALLAISACLRQHREQIQAENKRDILGAKEFGISDVMIDRLSLNSARIDDMADAVEKLVALADPIGEIESGARLENGLLRSNVRVPLGVVGMIYESRPNVTVEAATLCFKTSNAVMLRGGKEAIFTNIALVSLMRQALTEQGLDPNCILLVENTSRESAREMMRLHDYLDVLIPRGGASLISTVIEHATVPIIETGTGNCHTYVDANADLSMAIAIVNNAKTSRPSVCNACESVLVHQDVAETFLPRLVEAFSHPVALRGCQRTKQILGDAVALATEEDYRTEFLDYILSVRVVETLEEAISHINTYNTKHSECIVTADLAAATRFTTAVDAAAVYVNASTRFTDGGMFGFGAEIGISTQKLHARGPMGLHALTSTKYILYGNGQIR